MGEGWSFVAALALLAAACQTPPEEDWRVHRRLPPGQLASPEHPFEPIPQDLGLDPERVELGRRLFEDPRLSGGGDVACVDCHALDEGGVVPGEARSNHPLNETGPYNVPTVFNVAFNFRYNWQGPFETLEEHLGGPMMNENVMDAGSWDAVVARLRVPYDGAFRSAGYPGVSEGTLKSALATYQRSLITPDARFDRFLRGEAELDALEAEGYALFRDVGCATCHQGINVGGNLYQRYGVMADAFDRELTERDYGRMLITGRDEDAHVFRVPSLRNVEVTAPYFHDGSAPTLEAAVRHMSRVQLGAVLDDGEVRAIVAFLRTLTGEHEGVPLAPEPP
ncbi:MAG: cytochrome c peroxidase [Myxococcota bacterium]|nr:cytochrome c peroxidase [Myxococcota bacterium]